jgi:hypothetical protein
MLSINDKLWPHQLGSNLIFFSKQLFRSRIAGHKVDEKESS